MSLDSSVCLVNHDDYHVPDFGADTLDALYNPRFSFKNAEWNRTSHPSDFYIRAFDLSVCLTALLVMLPVLLFICLLIQVSSPGPIIFVQQRIGKHGALFPCFKFRTMVPDAEERLQQLLASSPSARQEWANDQKLKNDPRITAIGQFLRKTSLDELPQILNIILGHMSIVGPRPIISSEIVRYGRKFDDYCHVHPGLTGLWQISGRNDVSYSERVALDVKYVQNRNLKLNVAICFKTLPALLFARGCY
tara:strand:+ start:312 stop:1058 length:747 start_codon:yes stop_codon:yes gene_type:complete